MRKLLLLVCMTLCILQAWAQNRTITGRILDDKGNPIPHASITIKGTVTGVTADAAGNFTIQVASTAKTLVVASLNFATQEIVIGSKANISVVLQESTAKIEEVVVVGYSTTTKEAFTGSAKVVSGEQLNNKNLSNVSQALAGEVAGVRAINTSGQPGVSADIRIRGIGSVNGNRAPLYVIDGIPYSGQLNALNMEDVANLTVLKDAAATSIYGSRGANGVIVITTRTGRGKKSFIEVDGKIGSNMKLLPRYSVISSPEEYISLSWQALYNQAIAGGATPAAAQTTASNNLYSASGISPNYNIWNAAGKDLIDPTTGAFKSGVTRKYTPEKWDDYAFQSSSRKEVNVKLGGSEGKTNYYTSFGYLKDNGYSIKTDFQRFVGRLNLNQEVKPWLSANVNINYANTTTNNGGQSSNSGSVFWFVDNMPSIYPLFLRDPATGNKVADPIFGGYQYDYGDQGRKFGSLTNAIADVTYNTSQAKRNELTGNTSLNLKFTKELSFETKLGVQYYNNAAVSRSNKFYGSSASQKGSISQTKTELMNLNLLNLLRYAKKFGDHDLEVLAAHEATNFKQNIANASGYNLVENDNLELNNAVVSNPSSSYSNTYALESYFAQANYNFNRTYYVSGTIRRDGSSRFIKGNTWGNFGSVGLGWVMTNMNFMKSLKFVDFLKLKASYGILGDQSGVGYYPGYDLYTINNLNNQPSFAFNTKGNPNLTWETSKMFQTGVEFKLGNYLTGSVDYYIKNTDNLIFNRRVGPSIGYALIQVNDGRLRNSGVEFDLTAHLINKKDYFFDFGINGEHFTNKIVTMPIDPATGQQKVIDIQSPYGWAVGHSVYDFYIRNYAGVDPTDGKSMWTVYYEDKNANGTFDAGEQVTDLETYNAANPSKAGALKTTNTKDYSQATQYYIGKSAIPKLRGGINLHGGWKGIDIAVQILYSVGGYAYDYDYAGLMGNGLIGSNNWSTDIRNAWKKAGDVTDVPRISNNADANVTATSSRFVTKADYLALNNVRIGYTIPSKIVKRTGILEEATVWVSGDNLWLATKRKGFNPATAEDGQSNTYRYNPLSTISAGLRVKF
ncbi:MAG: SusC/RagA family TonB-linked outer membrane protein [Filimonas sp.]|nr:SusC/RagA family TonB-linked outer membrane protein [Filimonas sp.]